MITLTEQIANEIKTETENILEKYQKPFNSLHEGLGVLREEYLELEDEIFFGEKRAKEEVKNDISPDWRKKEADKKHKERVRKEAIQVAAIACRIIQELT